MIWKPETEEKIGDRQRIPVINDKGSRAYIEIVDGKPKGSVYEITGQNSVRPIDGNPTLIGFEKL